MYSVQHQPSISILPFVKASALVAQQLKEVVCVADSLAAFMSKMAQLHAWLHHCIGSTVVLAATLLWQNCRTVTLPQLALCNFYVPRRTGTRNGGSLK